MEAMTANRLSRLLAPALFTALGLAACSTTVDQKGATNVQGTCLAKRARCIYNTDCCSGFCANDVCVGKEP